MWQYHVPLQTQIFLVSALIFAVLLLSSATDAPIQAEKPFAIDVSNGPAAIPKSVEARLDVRQHRESVALNRFTFPGNVLNGTGDVVDHWIVMFCPSWHDKCQGLLPSYELLGVQWENKLNKALMSSTVRFAKVDCATEKDLCVTLDIDEYPSVVHYRNGNAIASWQSGAPGLVRFVKQALEGPRRRVSSTKRQNIRTAGPLSCPAGGGSITDGDVGRDRVSLALRAVCLILALLAAARCLWVLVRSLASDSRMCKTTLAPSKERGNLDHARGGVRASSPSQASLPLEWVQERPAIVL